MSYLVLLRKVPSFNIYVELGNARYDRSVVLGETHFSSQPDYFKTLWA